MIIAILSDIHGNLPALKAVLKDIQKSKVDKIIVAGDTTGEVWQNQVFELLSQKNAIIIQGNGENTLIQYSRGETESEMRYLEQYAGFRWKFRDLNKETLDFITHLPEQRIIDIQGTSPIRLVHGSPQDISEGVLPEFESENSRNTIKAGFKIIHLIEALDQVKENVLICGHTHVPWIREFTGKLAVNPGSVGRPCNGDPSADYALLAWRDGCWNAELKTVSYNWSIIRKAFYESGFLTEGGAFALASLLCVESGRDVVCDFIIHLNSIAACEVYKGSPDLVYRKAQTTFDWPCSSHERKGYSDV